MFHLMDLMRVYNEAVKLRLRICLLLARGGRVIPQAGPPVGRYGRHET